MVLSRGMLLLPLTNLIESILFQGDIAIPPLPPILSNQQQTSEILRDRSRASLLSLAPMKQDRKGIGKESCLDIPINLPSGPPPKKVSFPSTRNKTVIFNPNSASINTKAQKPIITKAQSPPPPLKEHTLPYPPILAKPTHICTPEPTLTKEHIPENHNTLRPITINQTTNHSSDISLIVDLGPLSPISDVLVSSLDFTPNATSPIDNTVDLILYSPEKIIENSLNSLFNEEEDDQTSSRNSEIDTFRK